MKPVTTLVTTTQAIESLGCTYHAAQYACEQGYIRAVKRAPPGWTREVWHLDPDELRDHLARKQQPRITIPTDTPALITTAQAAEISGLAISTIHTLLKKDKLVGFKTWLYVAANKQRHHKWLISIKSLRQYIETPPQKDYTPPPWTPVTKPPEPGELSDLQQQVIAKETGHQLVDLQPDTKPGAVRTWWDNGESFVVYPNGETDGYIYEKIEEEKPPVENIEVLTVAQAAEIAQVGHRAIRRAITRGELPASKKPLLTQGGYVRKSWAITPPALNQWMDSRQKGPL